MSWLGIEALPLQSLSYLMDVNEKREIYECLPSKIAAAGKSFEGTINEYLR